MELFNKLAHGAAVSCPFSLVHRAFEHQVDLNPNVVAAEQQNASITYMELERQANRLSNYLVGEGLPPRSRVCIVVQRSIPMLVAILAVLKSGCQYIPLDGGVASEKALQHIFEDTNAEFIISSAKFEGKVRRHIQHGQRVYVLEQLSMQTNLQSQRPSITMSSEDGAYVIYTSGTTGMPKGVDVKHGNVTNLLKLHPGNLGITTGTRVAQLLNISFDMAVWEMLGTLMNGGTLVLRASDWRETMRQVQTVIMTPSILAQYSSSDFPDIRTVAVGGERCPQPLADEWASHGTFMSICGPTEITILNTAHLHKVGQEISIGRPIPNTSVYILDENASPKAIGEPGLMWVGGKGVTRGYINLPGLTAERYRPDPFKNDGSMMYNTGDLVSWRADGSLDILGRIDDQIKMKGFRVELDGVARVLEKFPGIYKASTFVVDGAIGAAFAADNQKDSEKLAEFAAFHLPYYAVPNSWIQLPEMPLTPNGKVDKKLLKEWIHNNSTSSSPALGTTTTDSVESLSLDEKAQVMVKKIEKSSCASSEKSLSLAEKGQVVICENSVSSTETLAVVPALPEKNGFHGERWLRHRFFSLYRRFFSVVLVANTVAAVFIIEKSLRTGSVDLQTLANATAANLTASTLMRQDHVINFLFNVLCAVPTSFPLFIRRQCARVFHIGGIHSGAGTAATGWFLAFSIAASVRYAKQQTLRPTEVSLLVVTYIALLLLLAIIVLAHPTFRQNHHDSFELVHRFAGWTALALVWAQTILASSVLSPAGTQLGVAVVRNPVFWLLLVITASIALPWARLRKVPVRAVRLSDHAIRLYFEYTNTYPGTAIRISERPLIEWHAFATIAEPDKKGFSLVVSNAGDWTRRQIDRVPDQLWVRGVPACGVLRIAPLFKSIVLVATGSGIGPCLPVIIAKRIPCRIFWSTPHPQKTFGDEIIQNVFATDPNAVVHDTRKDGKPDMIAVSYRLYVESKAEAVCVISNKKLTQKIVYAMEARGIPAFGAIFDS